MMKIFPGIIGGVALAACSQVSPENPPAVEVSAAPEIAETTSGGPEDISHLSAEWQIEAYSTAGPSFIGENATILSVDGTVLREGTNGWTCMPGNPRPVPEGGWGSAHEAMPVCGDSEAFKWMMAYMNNTEHDMLHDGYMWMLHGDMGEDNTKAGVLNKADAEDPANWIESGAHLMRMPKDPSSLDGMTTDFRSGAPYVMFSGTPWAHLMIPVEGYYDYSE